MTNLIEQFFTFSIMSMFSIIYIGAQQNNPHGADLRVLYKISKGKEMQKKKGGGGENVI